MNYREKEVFPHRVELNADVVLDEPDYIDGYQLGPTLEYVKKWPPHLWAYAFTACCILFRSATLISSKLS